MRLFIAIYPDKELVHQISASYSGVNKFEEYFERMSDEEFHITLQFLGEVFDEYQSRLENSLKRAIASVTQFPVETNRILFGIGGKKLYLEVVPSSPLLQLKEKVDEAVKETGISVRTDSFIPHISMTRAKQYISQQDKERIINGIKGMAITSTFIVRSIHLIKSELTHDGPNYTTLATIPLNPIQP